MFRFLATRLASAAVAALLSSLAVFLLMRAVPGDIVGQMLGQSGNDRTAEAALRGFFGLDRPLWAQFGDWLANTFTGNLGRSWYQGRPVATLVWDAFLVTAEIAVATLVIATLIGVPLGVLAGIREGTRTDAAIQAFNLLGLSAPVFWIGLMLMVGASALLEWSPPFAYMPPTVDLAENINIIILPVLSLSLLQAAAYSHFVRDTMVTELRREYVRAAIAKGLAPRQVYFKHALRNILIPLVTFIGLILIQILGGAVVIESLFSLPGLGRLILSGIQGRDYPVVQGALLFVVLIAIVVNFAIDLLYGLIDPRLRS
ncbi:peptide/nickel transport system permease protein [Stella humosa]|uniref:Peptide/nickel transport system permease protein n=1 Tax=Stella humosa TaxID=94 RepID=A0A3N1ME80_9PROT|nr:ABC transporter permease [Stella humosa]ROQ02033.1 peptide/nickel transport system permease protein [Stella humosa]BBK32423.1 peptide ABC transporter [Stella humosa]